MTDERSPVVINATERGIAVIGEIDAATAPAVIAAATLSDRGHLEIELSGVDFIDSSGLRMLLQLHKRAIEIGGSVTLHRPSEAVRRLLAVSGVDEHLLISE